MRVFSRLFLCAVFSSALTLPALALERDFGSVNVSASQYTDVRWSRFGGPVDHFSFIPESDAIECEHVTINYMDGTSHDVFSGFVAAGQRTTISLPPPNDGRIRDVDFACKAKTMDGARIALSAVTDSWPNDWDSDHPAHIVTEAH